MNAPFQSWLGGVALAALTVAACSNAPASSMNFAPVILDADPAIGSIVTPKDVASVPSFTVTVSDPNLEDDLHVRWIADFPPDTANTRDMVTDSVVTHNSNGAPLNQPDSVTPSCKVHNLAKIPQHQIMVVVADRPFDDSSPPPGTPVDLTRLTVGGGRKVIATWTLNLDCP